MNTYCRHDLPIEGCCSMCDGNREERRRAAGIMNELLASLVGKRSIHGQEEAMKAAAAYVAEAEEGGRV